MTFPNIVHIGETAYEVKREIRDKWFKRGVDHFGASKVTEELNCDKLLKGRNGEFLLVDIIKEVEVIEYVEEVETDIQSQDGEEKTE